MFWFFHLPGKQYKAINPGYGRRCFVKLKHHLPTILIINPFLLFRYHGSFSSFRRLMPWPINFRVIVFTPKTPATRSQLFRVMCNEIVTIATCQAL
jgi:hypothetical protein